jgi:hypothetical protein
MRPEDRIVYEHQARKFSDDVEDDGRLAEQAAHGIYPGQNWHSDYYERGREGEDSSFLYIHGAWGGPE